MSRRPPPAKKDGNHDDCVGAFEALGCSVTSLHATRIPGLPDTLVGCVGVTHLVEIKNPDTAYGRAGLSKSQTPFARDWRGGPVWLCRSPDEAAALVQHWRASARPQGRG